MDTSGHTHVLIVELSRFTFAWLDQLDLASGESDEEHRGLCRGCGRVEVVTRGIRSLVQLLVDWFADIGRLEDAEEYTCGID